MNPKSRIILPKAVLSTHLGAEHCAFIQILLLKLVVIIFIISICSSVINQRYLNTLIHIYWVNKSQIINWFQRLIVRRKKINQYIRSRFGDLKYIYLHNPNFDIDSHYKLSLYLCSYKHPDLLCKTRYITFLCTIYTCSLNKSVIKLSNLSEHL